MATLELLTRRDLPAYEYTVQLEGITYELRFTFNDRMSKWMISILDVNANLLVGEVPVIVNYPIFDRYKVVGLPPGTIYAFDTANTNTDPGRYELGARVRIFYQESTGP